MNTNREDIKESLKIDGFAVTNKQVEEISAILQVVKYSESDPQRFYKLLNLIDKIKRGEL